MEQDDFNRLLQNAIEQSKAELQQRHEEQLKAVEERLTRKSDDEVRELCNLQSYPIDSKWSFTYEPYGASDESGLAAETDQADGAQILRV